MDAVFQTVKNLLKVPKPKETLSVRSLYLFKRDNKLRKVVHWIVCSWIFEYFILASIVTSCVVVKNSRSQNAYDMSNPYAVIDLLMNIIFGVEAILKIITYGFVMHRGSYLRNKWNIIDFLILIGGATSDIVLMFSNTKKSISVKVLRLFRVMRPLRLIVRYDSLKVVLDTIITSFKTLVHVLSFLLLIVVMYAIVGIELFKGAFQSYCVNADNATITEPVTLCTITDSNSCLELINSTCREAIRDPESSVSFDGIGYALLTVVQVITMEDWMFIAYKLDRIRNSIVTHVYFISLVFIGGYFAAGLLMGVLGNEFLKTKLQQSRQKRLYKEKMKALEGVEDDQISIVNRVDPPTNSKNRWNPVLNSLVFSIKKPFTRKDAIKERCLSIVKSRWFFAVFMLICIFDIIMSSVYAHSTRTILTPNIFLLIKVFIAVLYTVELILVIMAWGFKLAPKHGTFVFDLFIWILIVIEFIVYAIFRTHFVGLSSARAIGLIRIFKYTRVWPQLSLLIKSFFKAVKGTCGLMILLVIVLSIYALLGNQLFSRAGPDDGRVDNFNTFSSSLLMAFVLLTGDGWKGFMDTEMTEVDTTLGVIYFISFVIVGNFILVNLFLGIIVDTLVSDYEENIITNEEEKNEKKLTSKNIEHLQKLHKGGVKKKKPKKSKFDQLPDSSHDVSNNSLIVDSPPRGKSTEVEREECLNEKFGLEGNSNCALNTMIAPILVQVSNGKNETRVNETNQQTNMTGSANSTSTLSQVNSNVSLDSVGDHDETVDAETRSVTDVIEKDTGKKCHFDIEDDSGPSLDKFSFQSHSTTKEREKSLSPKVSISEPYFNDKSSNDDIDMKNDSKRDSTPRATFRRLSVVLDHAIGQPIPRHLSLYMFSHHNKFRIGVYSIITSTPCTIFIWFAIVTSSLLLAFQDPLKENAKIENIMQIVDYVFTIIFLIEIILKSIAYGFVFGHKNCYLRDPINIIDTLVVFVAILNFTLVQVGISNLVQLRMLRAVRVVRILKLSTELKEVLNCLFNSIQKICHFLLLYILINYVYAVVGVQLYKDVMGTCSNGNSTSKPHCHLSGDEWTPTQLSFDNLYQGIVALFVIGTTDDWFGFLQKILANPENSEFMATIFIISFILVMSFLLLQVLTGFVIVGYHKEREKDERYEVLDKSAQECILAAYKEKPNRSMNWTKWKFRERLFDIISTTTFQVISLGLIILNTIVLVTQQYKEPDWLVNFQRYSNLVFTLIFTVEIIMKCIAVPIRHFIRDAWLVFDTLLILGGWIDIILYELQIASLNTSLFRLFRVARLMKFVGKGGNLRQLFRTFIKSMKSVPSIAIVLGLLLYLYAILGMELFGCMQLDLDDRINRDVNFRTFGRAVLVLIRITTMDAWQDVMLGCAHPEAHTCNLTTSSWQPYLSYIYFASFILVCSFWVINLFLAVIMDNFVYLTHDASTLSLCHVQAFVAYWHVYDKHGVGYISTEDLIKLLKHLVPPIGKGMFCPAHLLYGKLTRLKIPVLANEVVKFDEVLLLLVLDALNLRAPNEVVRHEIQLLLPGIDEETLDRILPAQYEKKEMNDSENFFYKNCAAYVITGHFKIYSKMLQLSNSKSVNTLSSNSSSNSKQNDIKIENIC